MKSFFQKCLVNQMASLQTFFWKISIYYRTLKRKHFSCSLCLLKSEFWTAGLQRQRKRENLDFFGIFEVLEHPFLSEHLQNVSVQCSPGVDCRLYSCDCIKWKLDYIRFSDSFPKFSAQLFQNALIKSSVTQFSRVMVCRLYLCLILKSDSTSNNFLKFLEVKLSPKACDEFLFWQQPAIFVTDLFTDVFLQVIVKNIMFKARSYGLQFQ